MIVPVPGIVLDMVVVFDHLAAHIADFKIPQYVVVNAPPRLPIPAASCSSPSSARTLTGPPPATLTGPRVSSFARPLVT
jgi:hypothetical protein